MHQQKDGQIDLPRSSAGERKERRGRKEERKGRKGVFLEKKRGRETGGNRGSEGKRNLEGIFLSCLLFFDFFLRQNIVDGHFFLFLLCVRVVVMFFGGLSM